jgi:hypothetical protein
MIVSEVAVISFFPHPLYQNQQFHFFLLMKCVLPVIPVVLSFLLNHLIHKSLQNSPNEDIFSILTPAEETHLIKEYSRQITEVVLHCSCCPIYSVNVF